MGDNPALWFLQVEASFAIWRITSDESKYRYVLVNLDPSVLPFVSDIVIAPPTAGKYDALKKSILNSFDETSETKLRKLLRSHELTNEKPSNLLQKLRNMAGGQCNDMVLRTLFLEHLPDNVRTILAISEVVDLSKLALQADKIFEMSNTNVNQVCLSTQSNNAGSSNNIKTEINELKATIEALTGQFKELRIEQRRVRNRSRSRFDRRNISPVPLQQEESGATIIADLGKKLIVAYYHVTGRMKTRKTSRVVRNDGYRRRTFIPSSHFRQSQPYTLPRRYGSRRFRHSQGAYQRKGHSEWIQIVRS